MIRPRTTPTLAPPRDLTIPQPGGTTARTVLSRALGRVLDELRALGTNEVQLGRVVESVWRTDRGALSSVARRPNVGTLVRCLRAQRTQQRVDELLATLCFELAALGALPAEVHIERLPARIVSLAGLRAVEFPDDATATFSNAGVVVHFAGGGIQRVAIGPTTARSDTPHTITHHAIDADLVLALVDNNPLAMQEAHPSKSGNAIDLGGRPAEEWVDAIRSSLQLIAQHLPELREELRLYVQQIVPVGYDAERHLSASYSEAIGTIYMTLHPSTMTMTEALIHELSHNKLNALLEIDDVLSNGREPLYSSPVRPDPRPLHAVLLAVHAFLPVARLYEAMLENDQPHSRSASFRARFREIVNINEEGARVVLEHGVPTHVGAGLLDEIARLRAHFASLRLG